MNLNKSYKKVWVSNAISLPSFIGYLILCLGLLVSPLAFSQDEDQEIEEVVVKGNVLYSDQVNALKTPVPLINVPQVSINYHG